MKLVWYRDKPSLRDSVLKALTERNISARTYSISPDSLFLNDDSVITEVHALLGINESDFIVAPDSKKIKMRGEAAINNTNPNNALGPSDVMTYYGLSTPTNVTNPLTIGIVNCAVRYDPDDLLYWWTNVLNRDPAQFIAPTDVFFPGYPFPSPHNISLNTSYAVETTLDIEWAMAMSPPNTKIKVYWPGHDEITDPALSEVIVSALSDPDVDIITMSWVFEIEQETNPFYPAYLEPLFRQAVESGKTLCGASGDWGSTNYNFDTYGVYYPESSPWVISVGGTQINETNEDEEAWFEILALGNYSSGGGGKSVLFQTPTYQQGISSSILQGARGCPDISLLAKTFLIFYGNDMSYTGTGTSYSSPILAGILANVQRSTKYFDPVYAPYGFLDYLYKMPDNCLKDITVGTNDILNVSAEQPPTTYNAGPGYDLTTGRGSINGQNFLNYLNTVDLAVPGGALPYGENNRAFVCQFSPDLTTGLNAVAIEGNNVQGQGLGVSSTSSGSNVYVTGVYIGSAFIYDVPTGNYVNFGGNNFPISVGIAWAYVTQFTSNLEPVNGIAIEGFEDVGFGVSSMSSNVYVTGYYRGPANIIDVRTGAPVTFGGNTFPATSFGTRWAFVGQFTPNLEPVNALAIEGNYETGNGVSTTSGGSNVYVTGYYYGTANIIDVRTGQKVFFGGNSLPLSDSKTSAFVAQFSSNLEPVNALAFQTNIEFEFNSGQSVTTTFDGSYVYVSGYYQGTANIIDVRTGQQVFFGSNAFPDTQGSQWVFISKFTSNLEPVNALVIKGNNDQGLSISVTPDGSNVYVTGYYYNGAADVYNVRTGAPVTFGGNSLPDNSLIGFVQYGYVAQFSSDLTIGLNAIAIEGTSDIGYGVSTTNSRVYVTGHYNPTANIYDVRTGAPVSFGGKEFPAVLGYYGTAIFIAEFNSSLTPLNGLYIVPPDYSYDYDEGTGVSAALDGSSIYVTGYYTQTGNVYNVKTNQEVFFYGSPVPPSQLPSCFTFFGKAFVSGNNVIVLPQIPPP